jgi:hypothetical protein
MLETGEDIDTIGRQRKESAAQIDRLLEQVKYRQVFPTVTDRAKRDRDSDLNGRSAAAEDLHQVVDQRARGATPSRYRPKNRSVRTAAAERPGV